MLLIVLARDAEQRGELLAKNRNKNVSIEFVHEYAALSAYDNADAFFVLKETDRGGFPDFTSRPVFINAVAETLHELQAAPNVSRLNAWPTFLKRNVWEIATRDAAAVTTLFAAIGWDFLVVPDKPGFIAARIIAMIINEAYYALGDGISSKEEINTSMRLGANYPYGPFEWLEIIGIEKVYALLQKLSAHNEKYSISPAMEAAVKSSNL